MNKRLQQLENNITILEKIGRDYTISDIKKDTTKEWALRYGFLESIQIMIDISCHIIVHQNLGNAVTYAECIKLLHKFDYIDEHLTSNFVAMTGLRNILVHEYVAVDTNQLYKLLERLDDFNSFAPQVCLRHNSCRKLCFLIRVEEGQLTVTQPFLSQP